MVDERDDETLVRAFQNGQPMALATLYRRHRSRLFRLALVWLEDAELAEDAVQCVFERGVRGLPRFRFNASPFTWLYRTLRNVCHEIRRKQAVVAEPVDIVDAAPTLELQHARLQTAQRVRTLVQRLPPRQREVVMLRIFEELSVADTAASMGCRQGTVKALLHKAKAALLRQWQDENDD
ncbi:MAG: RNA polymerase sigma factor [Pseudomonadota bacterium]